MINLRRLSAGLLVCCIVLMTGCSERTGGVSSQSTRRSEVTLQYWIGSDVSDIYEELAARFTAMDNKITIEITRVDSSERAEALMEMGRLPDVVTLGDTALQNFINSGLLLELDSRFEEWSGSQAFGSWYIEAMRGRSGNGKLYALPQSVNLPCLWYRADVFSAKGIDPPATWDAYFEAAKALKGSSAGVYGCTLRGGAGSVEQFLYELVSYVGETKFFSESGEAVMLAGEAAAEYATGLAALYQAGMVPQGSLTADNRGIISDFDAGVAVMLLHNWSSYSNHQNYLKEEQIGVLPLPRSEGSVALAQPAFISTAVLAGESSAEQAAWEFLAYISESGQIRQINNRTGWLSPVLEDGSGGVAGHETESQYYQLLVEHYSDPSAVIVSMPTYLPHYAWIVGEFGEPLFAQMLSGEIEPHQFTDALKQAFEAAYAYWSSGGTQASDSLSDVLLGQEESPDSSSESGAE